MQRLKGFKMHTFNSKNNLFTKKNIYIICIILLAITTPLAYSRYNSNKDINIITKAGKITYDIKTETKDTYVDGNKKFFYIYINNYEEKDNVTYVNPTNCNYTLTVGNEGNDIGTYRYQAEDGTTNGDDFEKTITYHGKLGTTKKTERIRVYVTSSNNLAADVDYYVNIEVDQTKKS